MVVPRTIGPQCPQHSVDEGEPNALYKATLFTPLCCMGAGHCSDVQHCAPALFTNARGKYTFGKAWKARRAHIEALADSGQEKTDRAKRIAVIKDTIPFKGCNLQSPTKGDKLCRWRLLCAMHRLISRRPEDASRHINFERAVLTILEFAAVPTGQHPDQLTLAEFAALQARQTLFHIDMDVDARNTVVVQAKSLANCVVEDDKEPQDEGPKIEFEDVGGAWHDDEQESGDEAEARHGILAEKI